MIITAQAPRSSVKARQSGVWAGEREVTNGTFDSGAIELNRSGLEDSGNGPSAMLGKSAIRRCWG